MRQFGKQTLTIRGLWGIFSLLLSFCFLVAPTTANTERFILDIYVTNPLSGSAIEGMDPVSYFTEQDPLVGTPKYEYEWEGVSWFFANEANKRVFMSSPESYAPQFGGYGLAGVARGYLSKGNPRIYVIYNQRLYLFYSPGNREAFLVEKAAMLNYAVQNWDGLKVRLARR